MKALVELTLGKEWDDYKDCSDEIIWTDLIENFIVGLDGVEPKLIKIERG